MNRKYKYLATGLATCIPGLRRFAGKGTGGTDSARYCYSVWLRHLVLAADHGLDTMPGVVAELGPGDSLGMGYAALLSGAERCFALDVVQHANRDRNLAIFDDLVAMFRSRTAIPGPDEFPGVKPTLESYRFPDRILDSQRLQRALADERVRLIRKTIGGHGETPVIRYVDPASGTREIAKDSVDMIFSQAVMEYVEDLDEAYRLMYAWLKEGGYISHQIDFKSHGTSDKWDGHREYTDIVWRMMKGRRPFFINRQPCSAHVTAITNAGFELVAARKTTMEPDVPADRLARSFRGMSDEDRKVAGALIQARKRRGDR